MRRVGEARLETALFTPVEGDPECLGSPMSNPKGFAGTQETGEEEMLTQEAGAAGCARKVQA